MIEQSAIGLNSREEANPFLDDGMLPLITAPMNTVVNENNYKMFLENKINVCLPRNMDLNWVSENYTVSVSLDDFIKYYIDARAGMPFVNKGSVCIDTANGNMPKLHEAIRLAKQIHGDNLVIIAGNIGSVQAFVELASTGVDYIRVGIGGSAVCTTSIHTGVGENNLLSLVRICNNIRTNPNILIGAYNKNIIESFKNFSQTEKENISKVKIIADSTSRFIKDNNLHPNGYAGINQLLYAGADLVMLGNIFNKAYESAGEKYIEYSTGNFDKVKDAQVFLLGSSEEDIKSNYYRYGGLYSLYRGMSTQEEQQNYKKGELRHSEGKSVYNKVEYKLSEWINGKKSDPDNYPGFINALKSAMSYTGSKTLKQFKNT